MRDLHLGYDEEGDILYLTFSTNRQASSISLNDNLVLRYDAQTHQAIGLTVIGFSDLLTLEREGKPLPLRDLTQLPGELGQRIKALITQPPLSLYLQPNEGLTQLTTGLARQFSLADLLLAA